MNLSRFFFFLLGLAASHATFAADYFVRLESQERAEITIQFGAVVLGPRLVSKMSPSSFGPVLEKLPSEVMVRWRFGEEPQRIETVSLRDGIPDAWDAVVFRFAQSAGLKVLFTQSVGGFRNLEIPLNESAEESRLRTLNESLYAASGLGQMQRVKDAVAQGANVNYLFGTIHPSPVRLAANGGHNEVVDFLIANGALVRKSDLVAPYLKERSQALGLEIK